MRLGLALLFSTSAALAERPLAPGAFFGGIEPGEDHGAVTMLRAPSSPRVLVPGAKFVMGARQPDIDLTLWLCQREPLANLCPSGLEVVILAELPAHEVTVSAFYLDRTEVTVEAYGRCVSAGTCGPAGFPPFDPRFDRPELPVTHVTYDDAATYCKFAGGRVPTEAEWELAARGAEGRVFPWGKLYNPHLCNHGSWAANRSDASDGFAGLAPVGSFKDGATPLGLLDMAGNAREWVQDRIDPLTKDSRGYAANAVTNPVITKGLLRVVRGGSYLSPAFETRGSARDAVLDARRSDVGFRCAYDAGTK